MELDGTASYLDGDGTLYLNFNAATAIEAGKPYIVKWTRPDGYTVGGGFDITNPLFYGVTVSADAPVAVASTDGAVSFVGSYSPVSLAANDKTVLYLGAENKLYWPSAAKTVGACRALFRLGGDAVAHARAFNLNFVDENTTGIISTTNFTNYTNSAGAWYDMQGRKLTAQPTKKGLYIHNGKKIIIK